MNISNAYSLTRVSLSYPFPPPPLFFMSSLTLFSFSFSVLPLEVISSPFFILHFSPLPISPCLDTMLHFFPHSLLPSLVFFLPSDHLPTYRSSLVLLVSTLFHLHALLSFPTLSSCRLFLSPSFLTFPSPFNLTFPLLPLPLFIFFPTSCPL